MFFEFLPGGGTALEDPQVTLLSVSIGMVSRRFRGIAKDPLDLDLVHGEHEVPQVSCTPPLPGPMYFC